tara:strand:+ start:32 stop:412 length:381 start_codon:yes stop_codon:yes gene_type:complete
MSYSKDFRRQLFKIMEEEKLTTKEASKRFGISIRSVFRWKHKSEPARTRNKPATKIDMKLLKKDIDEYPDGYLDERAERLRVSRTCVFYAMRRLKVTYKKNAYASKTRRRTARYLQKKDQHLAERK